MSFNGDLYPTAGADVVMTTSGDMVKYESGARARLGIGSANQILQVKSSLPSWETLSTAGSILTTQGDVLYENASGLARLGFGTSGDVLTTKGTGANPVWETPSGVSLSDNNTWTGVQTFEDDIETTQGIKYPASLKRNFEDSFNGAAIKPYWIFGNIVGSGTGALTTGVGNGFKITTAAQADDRSGISTNSLFMMDSRSVTMYGIFKFDNSENLAIQGVANSVDSELGKSVACLLDTDNTNIALHLSDSSISDTESDVALGTSEVYWKIICNATNARLFLIVGGVWTLKVTATTQYPNVGVSPNCFVKTHNTTTAIADFLYYKVVQD